MWPRMHRYGCLHLGRAGMKLYLISLGKKRQRNGCWSVERRVPGREEVLIQFHVLFRELSFHRTASSIHVLSSPVLFY